MNIYKIKPPVDKCSDNTHNCPQHSSCEDTLEGFHCKADSGFACIDETGACKDSTVCEGNSCRFTVDECANDSNKCPENSSCVNTETGYTCKAVDGFECNGANCLPDKSACVGSSCTFMKPPVDECSDNTHNCPQHSSCEDTLEGFHCKADSGFACIDGTGACKDSTLCEGNSCRFTVDECASQSDKCPEKSSCINTETGYTCVEDGDVLWGLDNDSQFHYKPSSSDTWKQESLTESMSQITCGKSGVFGIMSDGEVLYRSGTLENPTSIGSEWKTVLDSNVMFSKIEEFMTNHGGYSYGWRHKSYTKNEYNGIRSISSSSCEIWVVADYEYCYPIGTNSGVITLCLSGLLFAMRAEQFNGDFTNLKPFLIQGKHPRPVPVFGFKKIVSSKGKLLKMKFTCTFFHVDHYDSSLLIDSNHHWAIDENGSLWLRRNGIDGEWVWDCDHDHCDNSEQQFYHAKVTYSEGLRLAKPAIDVATGRLGLFALVESGHLFYRIGTHEQEGEKGSDWQR